MTQHDPGRAGHDVTVPGADDEPPSPAYAAVPDGATRGVVIIHELYGRSPEVDRVVDRFAAAGYAAVAPDLFHRGRAGCVRRTMHAIRNGGETPATRQARRARDWLVEHAGLPVERIGVIGFCFGGGFALLVGHDFGAVSTNYGLVPPAEQLRGLPPTIGCYGGRDRLFRGRAPELRERLEQVGVPHEVHVFDDVGHSFLTDGDRPFSYWLSQPLFAIRYDAEVAEEGWRRIFAFFERHLGDGLTARRSPGHRA